MIVIGLTGGIASGKSTISGALAEHGATVVDADKVGHDGYRPGTEGWRKVVDAFGKQIVAPDGEIDRKALGAIVFGDPAHRERLQAIVWPLMKGMMRRLIDDFRNQGIGVAVIEAAVLIEADWVDLVDQVWVVTVPVEVAAARLIRPQRSDSRSGPGTHLRSAQQRGASATGGRGNRQPAARSNRSGAVWQSSGTVWYSRVAAKRCSQEGMAEPVRY